MPAAPTVWARLPFAATALVSLLGLLAELGYYLLSAPGELVEVFSLSYEANVPTWYATVLLFSCAGALSREARAAVTDRARWWVLAILFTYISLDEAIQIHEYATFVDTDFDPTGILYFSWVVPAAAVVLALGLAYLPFLLRLPRSTRVRFVVAGAIYVGGALGMELPLGWWTEREGDDSLGYGLIDWVEETMELLGASLFLRAIVLHGATSRPEAAGEEGTGARGSTEP